MQVRAHCALMTLSASLSGSEGRRRYQENPSQSAVRRLGFGKCLGVFRVSPKATLWVENLYPCFSRLIELHQAYRRPAYGLVRVSMHYPTESMLPEIPWHLHRAAASFSSELAFLHKFHSVVPCLSRLFR